MTREGFRRLLLGSLDITHPVDAFPSSHDGNRTPPGGISVSGARAQRDLNRAAYEDNIRRSAGKRRKVNRRERCGINDRDDIQQCCLFATVRHPFKGWGEGRDYLEYWRYMWCQY